MGGLVSTSNGWSQWKPANANPNGLIIYETDGTQWRRPFKIVVVVDNTGYADARKFTGTELPEFGFAMTPEEILATMEQGAECTIAEANNHIVSGVVRYDVTKKAWVNTNPEFADNKYDADGCIDTEAYIAQCT